MQCFNDSGHKDDTGGQQWRDHVCVVAHLARFIAAYSQVSAVLIGPEHQMMLSKPNGTGHSDWLNASLWYVGDEFKDDVDSIDIDY